ncbi:MAG: molybdenum cofactor synthesis domain-containing protein, partial [Fusobacteriaceae bacterium]
MGRERNIYIDNIELEEALKILEENIKFATKIEKISVKNCCKRVVSKSIFAQSSSPSYSASAMDGIFLFSELTSHATEMEPVFLNNDSFEYVNTGEALDYKKGDTVIMIEDAIPVDENRVKIYKSAKPWQHVRVIGEDIVQGEMILKENHLIQPQDLAALISAGIAEIEVIKKPTVGIIPTGDEVIDIFNSDFQSREKKVIDSNSYMFSAMIEEWNGVPTILPKSNDNIKSLKDKIMDAVEKYDIVVINAGSSAGSKDFSKTVIEELGKVIIHGIAIKPGKPTIIGEIKNKLVLGIPGYPVSAFLSLEIFLKPLIEKLSLVEKKSEYIQAELSKSIVSSLKFKEYVRVSLSYIGDKLIATPLSRGAGITMSLVKADGILEVPKYVEGISSKKMVNIRLLKSIEEIKDYLVSIGSHDIIMEHISDKIKLVSTHVGSFGGVLA